MQITDLDMVHPSEAHVMEAYCRVSGRKDFKNFIKKYNEQLCGNRYGNIKQIIKFLQTCNLRNWTLKKQETKTSHTHYD